MTGAALFASPPHLPGRTARPDDSVFAPFKAGLHPGLPERALADSAAFRAGLEAFERRYYWEAHELFEAVWTCLPPAGAARLMLRGLIQLANAGLKARMGRARAATRILALADAARDEIDRRRAWGAMGITAAALATLRAQVAGESEG